MKQIVTLIVFMVFSSVSIAASSNDAVNSEYVRRAVKNNLIFIMESEEISYRYFREMVNKDHEGTYKVYKGTVMIDGHLCFISPKDSNVPIDECVSYNDAADKIFSYLLETDGKGEEIKGVYVNFFRIAYSRSYEYFKKYPELAKVCSKVSTVLCYSAALVSIKYEGY